jgi:hypothetical protein
MKGIDMGKKKWWQRQNKSKKNKKQPMSQAQKRRANYTTNPKGKQMSEDKTPITVGKVLTDEEFEKAKAQHDKGGAFKQVPARQGCWDAGIEILASCDKMEAPAYHIEFDLLAHQKINKLKASYPSLEWLAYLVGTVDREANKVTVEDLVIPDSQQVTSVSVYNVEYEWGALPDGKSICGVIHSHHSMGAFFSGTDDAYINQNHDVSIVVATAKGREIKSQVRVKAPCGAYILSENITYSINYPTVLDEDAFEAEFKSKIKTYTPPVTYVYSGGNYLGNYSGGYSGRRGISSVGNTYGGRGTGNPPRESQLYLGYDSEDNQGSLWDELADLDGLDDDQYPDPFTMDAVDVRDHLMDYYAEEDVDEFMRDGLEVAQQELQIVQNLCAEGLQVGRTDKTETEIVWDLSEEEDAEYDPNRDVNAQNGASQVSYGIPLKDQEDDIDPWTTEEDKSEISKDDPLYKRLNDELEAEGLFKNMSEEEKDRIIREAIEETEDMTANG